jgi:hypothetical protein
MRTLKSRFYISSLILAVTVAVVSFPAVVGTTHLAPTITASPNPVIVPAGKTEGTSVITWDAGADRSDSRVWLQVDNGKEDIFATSGKGSSETKVVMGKTYVFKLYSGDGTQVLASISVKAELPKPSLAPINRSAPGTRPTYIYGVLPDGTLRWYRHDGSRRGVVDWQGPRDIATGLQGLKQAFGGDYEVFYTIASDGTLKRYPHSHTDVAGDFATKGTEVPRNVGNGWQNFKQVFSTSEDSRFGGDPIIYAIAQDDTLKWYRFGDKPWENPKDVGSGWGNFKTVFSTGEGIIYAITQEGKLLWHKHNFFKYGVGAEGQGSGGQTAWEGPKEVGRGWQNFKHVFSSNEGVIYAVTKEGKLLWYKHQGYLNGLPVWLGPREVASAGWEKFEHVFAILNSYTGGSRSGQAEVKRLPPIFSTPPESFFGDLIVQPGRDRVIISYSPAKPCRAMIAVSTRKPYALPDTLPLDQADKVSIYPQEAKASVYCSDSGAWYMKEPSEVRRDCQITGLANNTTYYFVIIADSYDFFEERRVDNQWRRGPAFYYSGSFTTQKIIRATPF